MISPVPWLLEYIQDKDLWTWALPPVEKSMPPSPPIRSIFTSGTDFKQKELEQEGRAILRYERNW